MGIFEQFPYSNFHNANLDNVLNNSNQALRDAANAVHIAGEAKDIAEGLTDDVATALQEAEAASTAAASAEATAAQAQAEAEAASGLAQDAYDLASAADSAAANALSVANTANSNASDAVATANAASTAASNAVATANTASTNASAAVSTANTASTNASAAVSTANTANTNASAAVSTANAALDAVNNIPDASTTERGLVSTEEQWFGGVKHFNETLRIDNHQLRIDGRTAAQGITIAYLTDASGTEKMNLGQLVLARSTTNGIARPSRWYFIVYSYNSTTGERTAGYETYRLPTVSAGLTSAKNYNIWTTKDIPEPPTTAGTYTLKATRTSNGVTYSWV